MFADSPDSVQLVESAGAVAFTTDETSVMLKPSLSLELSIQPHVIWSGAADEALPEPGALGSLPSVISSISQERIVDG